MAINMEVYTIDSRMKALGKKYRELERASTSVIWKELINVIDQYLSGCQSSAFETFYKLFLQNVDSIRTCTIENKALEIGLKELMDKGEITKGE